MTLDSARRLLWFVVPMGIAAGYVFDLVYARLLQLTCRRSSRSRNNQ
jgi:hypothetical protein